MSSEEKINASMIIEVLGRPPEHLTEVLGKIVERIGEEKDVSIINKKLNAPVEMKDKKDLFTTFAEIEVETKSIKELAILMFKYMPAHIEILSPENLKLSNNDLGEIFNELTRRLHGYDEIARVMQVEKRILEDKLRNLLEKNKGNDSDSKELGETDNKDKK